MANGFLNLLPFRPRRFEKTPVKRATQILPAEDILDFEYPPESAFRHHDDLTTDDEDMLSEPH